MQAACYDFLTEDQTGLGAAIMPALDAAAAKCHVPPPPPPPCDGYPDYNALVGGDSAPFTTCCPPRDRNCNAGGMPSDTCSPECAEQVNIVKLACAEFLQSAIGLVVGANLVQAANFCLGGH